MIDVNHLMVRLDRAAKSGLLHACTLSYEEAAYLSQGVSSVGESDRHVDLNPVNWASLKMCDMLESAIVHANVGRVSRATYLECCESMWDRLQAIWEEKP